MGRRLRHLFILVLVVLIASTSVYSAPAEARIIDIDRVDLSVPGAAFGRGRVWFGEFASPATVQWGDGSDDFHLTIIGQLAATDFWNGGCADLSVRTMTGTAVLESLTYRNCKPPLSIILEPGVIGQSFTDSRIRHVEICLSFEGQRRTCAFETRPFFLPTIPGIGQRIG